MPVEKSKDAIVVGEAQCPECGKWVELIAEPDMWETQKDGTEKIIGYWPGANECCGYILAEEEYGEVRQFGPIHPKVIPQKTEAKE